MLTVIHAPFNSKDPAGVVAMVDASVLDFCFAVTLPLIKIAMDPNRATAEMVSKHSREREIAFRKASGGRPGRIYFGMLRRRQEQ
jgi:hypothetical protein